ncbi:MAG: biotin--[acetyl-CoA-carboxylase] ligase [Caldilineaceae bacterium]|nr:biotin--[acetyl-CoA-carboxylase] ligase [Caldilineaceae bacterium]
MMSSPLPAMHDLPDPLDLPRLRHALAASPVGHTIVYAAGLPSTMPVAAAQIRDPASRSGLLVVAEEQTAGRGRGARPWHAPPRVALLVSIALKPPRLHLPLTHLSIAAAIAARDAVVACAPHLAAQLTFKWPNDLLLGPTLEQAGKLGGILIQTALSAQGGLDYAVAGIGLNANQRADQLPAVAPPALPPTSLRIAQGAPIDRTALLIALCQAFAAALERPPHQLRTDWRDRLSTLGRRVALYARPDDPTPVLTGQAVDVDVDGALLLQDDQGRRHTVHAGDLALRPAE